MNIYLEILLLVLSYILGSIPFGLLLGKIKGIDLREVGSKNIGTTNAWRNLGPGLGILTLILDVFKAVIILGLVRYNVIPNEGIIIDPIFYGLASLKSIPFILPSKRPKGIDPKIYDKTNNKISR